MNNGIHIVCPHCHVTNRIPDQRLTDQPRCGRCREPIFGGGPVALTGATFDKHIEKNGIPVVVDFWAPWCGPCKMMAPQFAEAARQLEPSVRLAKVNTEAEQSLAARFGIRSIPTLVIFKNGREIARQPGAMNAPDIVRWVRTNSSATT